MIFPKLFPVRSTPRVSQKGAIESTRKTIIPADWLRKKITVEEAEADIGCENREWGTLKTKIGLNDELWTFSSPADYWQQFRGSRGVALLRDGKIIEVFVTEIN
jgi:hypothetical protein